MPSMARSSRRCAKLPNLGLRPFRLGLLRAVRRPDAVPHDPQHLPYLFPVIGIGREPIMRGEQPRHAVLEHREIRSEEHTSELQSLMRNSYAVFCLKKKKLLQIRK